MHRKKSRKGPLPIALTVAAACAAVATALVTTGALHRARTALSAPAAVPTTPPPAPDPPLALTSASPGPGAGDVSPISPIVLHFSSALDAATPMPSLSPPVVGSWSLASPTTLVFTPAADYVPGSSETVVVPAGPAGMEDAAHHRLGSPASITWSVVPGSTERLEQLLATLGYLPLTFTPAANAPSSPLELALVQAGAFAWRYPNTPASLQALWQEGAYTVMTKGAVMTFESQHGLTTDGIAGPEVWKALLDAAAFAAMDPAPYTYAEVTLSRPQRLTIWDDGQIAFMSLANTGIPASPTQPGTWPVYLHLTSTTMRGTNPDGSHYDDPGVPWVSYFHGGDALHGFWRSNFGYPQSLGCVELPIPAAAQAFPLTPIGTLVTVG